MSTKTENKISINAVEIEIAGTKIKLTLEQVAELKKILAKAFPEKEIVYVPGPERVIHEPVSAHWPKTYPWKNPYWEITCQATSDTSGLMRLKASC